MGDSEKKVAIMLKEQLEELCKVNSKLLKKAKKINLGDAEIETLKIVNNSINKIGSLFNSDMTRW